MFNTENKIYCWDDFIRMVGYPGDGKEVMITDNHYDNPLLVGLSIYCNSEDNVEIRIYEDRTYTNYNKYIPVDVKSNSWGELQWEVYYKAHEIANPNAFIRLNDLTGVNKDA